MNVDDSVYPKTLPFTLYHECLVIGRGGDQINNALATAINSIAKWNDIEIPGIGKFSREKIEKLVHAEILITEAELPFVVELSAEILASAKEKGMNTLHLAAITGNFEWLRVAIDLHPIEECSGEGSSPLCYAAGHPESEDCVHWLLAHGANPRANDRLGRSPLTLAAEAGDFKSVEMLFRKVARDEGNKALIAALQKSNHRIATFLAEFHFNLLLSMDSDTSPLLAAAFLGHQNVVEFILKNGGSPFVKDCYGETALTYALRNGQLAIAEFLLVRDPKLANILDNQGHSPLYHSKENLKAVNLLLKYGADPSLTDSDQFNMFHWAASLGRADLMQAFLSYSNTGINCKAAGGETPLDLAAKNNHVDVVRLLFDIGVVFVPSADHLWSPLEWAVQNGCLETVRYMLTKLSQNEVNAQSAGGSTAFYIAVSKGYADVCLELLNSGKADPTIAPENCVSPLAIGVMLNNDRLFQMLIDCKWSSEQLEEALYQAVKREAPKMVECLLDKMAKIAESPPLIDKDLVSLAIENEDSITLSLLLKAGQQANQCLTDTDNFYDAIWSKDLECVRLMLEYGADPHIHYSGHSLISACFQLGFFEVFPLLAEFHPTLFDYKGTGIHPFVSQCISKGDQGTIRFCKERQLHLPLDNLYLSMAISRNDKEILWTVLNELFDWRPERPQGLPPLHVAAREDDPDKLAWLLDCGCGIDEQDEDGCTPLQHALKSGNGVAANLLMTLSKGGEPGLKDKMGKADIHHAAQGGVIPILDAMLKNSPDSIELADHYGMTPLLYACTSGRLETVKFLVDQGANVKAINSYGYDMLKLAAINGRYEVVRYLVEVLGQDVMSCLGGCYPLHSAVQSGNLPTIEYLLDKHSAPAEAVTENDHHTALHTAAASGQSKVVQLLLDKGFDPMVKSKSGCNALHEACRSGNGESAEVLLRSEPALYKDKDNRGNTPLQMAGRKGHIEPVKKMQELGYLIGETDHVDKTILVIAAIYGQTKLLEYLISECLDLFPENTLFAAMFSALLHHQFNCAEIILKAKRGVIDEYNDETHRITLLHLFAREGDKPAIEWLVRNGANPLQRSLHGDTPLHTALQFENDHLIEPLSKNQKIHSTFSRTNHLPLIMAIYKNQHNSVIELVKHGPSLDSRVLTNCSPLCYAAEVNPTMVPLLINLKASPGAIGSSGFSIWQESVLSCQKTALEVLLENKADPMQKTSEGNILHMIALNGNNDMLEDFFSKYPFESRSLVNQTNDRGQTPALLANTKASLGLLLKKGGKLLEDKDGLTPYQRAITKSLDTRNFIEESFTPDQKLIEQERILRKQLYYCSAQTFQTKQDDYDSGSYSSFFCNLIADSFPSFASIFPELVSNDDSLLLCEQLVNKSLEDYRSAIPKFLRTGYAGHHVMILLWNSYFVVCNRGGESRKPVEVFCFDSDNLSPLELLAINNLNEASAEVYRKYLFEELPVKLSFKETSTTKALERIFSTLPMQGVGSCTYTSTETAVGAFLLMRALFEGSGNWVEEGMRCYEAWKQFMSVTALHAYANFGTKNQTTIDKALIERAAKSIKDNVIPELLPLMQEVEKLINPQPQLQEVEKQVNPL